MGRIILILVVFTGLTSFTGPGDPPEVGISFNSFWKSKSVAIAGYTKINARYEWVAGAFDSGLHVPQYNGLPTGSRSGVWNADGAIAADTANSRLYLYSAGVWNLVGGAGTTPGLQTVITQDATLTTDNTINVNGNELAFDASSSMSFEANSGIEPNIQFSANKSGVRSDFLIYHDSILIKPNLGQFIIDSLNYTLSTTGKKIMLRDTATGLVQNIDASLLVGVNIYNSDGTLTGSRSVNGDGNDMSFTNFSAFDITSNSGSFNTTADIEIKSSDGNTSLKSTIGSIILETNTDNKFVINGDSVRIFPPLGKLNIDSLRSATDTTTRKPMVWSPATGRWEYLTYWPGGGGGSGVTTMAAIGSSPNANGATISGSTLNLEPASASFGGVVTTGTQTIAGNKTFTGVSVFGSPTVPVGNFQVGGTIWISGGAGSTYYAVHDGTNQSTLAPTAMTFTGIGSGSIGYASGVMNIQGNATYSTVFNDNSADVDFRLEGDGDANLIFADAGNDKVGIGTASPTTKLHVAGRFAATQGADVASAAGAITLGTDGNTFEITGTAAITLISNAGWVNGSEINLVFTSTATLTDGTANSGTDIGMELDGNANFTGSADDIVTLVLCEVGGTQRWRMKSKSIN